MSHNSANNQGVDINTKALTAFLFSLGSCLLCPIASPLAWLYAAKVSQEGMTKKDLNMLQAAKVIAIFMTCVLAIGFVLMLAGMLVAIGIPVFAHYVDNVPNVNSAIMDSISDQVDSFTDSLDSLKMIFAFYP